MHAVDRIASKGLLTASIVVLATPAMAQEAVPASRPPVAPAAVTTAALPRPDLGLRTSACPTTAGTDVLVCGRSEQRYRLPPKQGFDPNGPVDSVLRERSRLLEGGESGTQSCNFVVGAGSWTGCEVKAMERARQQGRQVSRFGDIKLNRR